MEKETIEFFNLANKAECFIHRIRKEDPKLFYKLRDESLSLEYEELDMSLYDCVFVEDPKFVRHVLNEVEVDKVESNFDYGMRKIDGARLRYWRDLFRGDIELEPEKHLLYLNYFTLFTGRTGGAVNFEMLENFSYLEGQFMKEKMLSKLITFSNKSWNSTYQINVVKTGNTSKLLLEKDLAHLETRIAALGGQAHEEN